MYIYTIIPIARGIFREELSYFGSVNIPVGSWVSIPVNGRKIAGIVIAARGVVDSKSEIKNASFTLRKISDHSTKPFLDPRFVAAARNVAEYTVSTTGAVIKLFLPEHISPLKELHTDTEKRRGHFEAASLSGSLTDRVSFYKSLIRESFARGESVLIYAVDPIILATLKNELPRGIGEYFFACTNMLSANKEHALREKAAATKHPILLVGDRHIFSIPRTDIGTIIVEHEHTVAQPLKRPFVSPKLFAEFLAQEYDARYIVAGSSPSLDTLARIEKKMVTPLSSIRTRGDVVPTQVVNMREYDHITQTKEKVRVISDEVGKRLLEIDSKGGHLVAIVGRRGISPTTLCGDCGTILVCETCTTPIVLHEPARDVRQFVCHRCGTKTDSRLRCRHCNSWKLYSFGFGTETVKKLLSESLPNVPIFQLDSDATPTKAKAQKVIEQFEKEPKAILVGTEMLFSYLPTAVPYVCILSLDNIFSVPDFRVHERLFTSLRRAQELATKELIVQTRHPEESLFQHLVQGDSLAFHRHELSERRKAKFPPFGHFIRVTKEGPTATVEKEFEALAETFSQWAPDIVDSTTTSKRTVAKNLILTLEEKDWPNAQILEKLRALPPSFVIAVDPDSLVG